MATTTKNKLAEQAARLIVKRIGRAYLTNAEKQEVQELIVQACNSLLAIDIVSEDSHGYISGLDDMSATAIAHYEGVNVSDGKVTLPVLPIKLPHDAGVWEVISDGTQVIPIPSSQSILLDGMGDEEYLEGLASYTRRGYTLTITGTVASSVDLSLIVIAPDSTEGDDPLPLSPEMALLVVTQVVKLFVPEQNEKA